MHLHMHMCNIPYQNQNTAEGLADSGPQLALLPWLHAVFLSHIDIRDGGDGGCDKVLWDLIE